MHLHVTIINLLFITVNIGTKKKSARSHFSLGDKYYLYFAGIWGKLCEEFEKSVSILQDTHLYNLDDTDFNPSTYPRKHCGLIVPLCPCGL